MIIHLRQVPHPLPSSAALRAPTAARFTLQQHRYAVLHRVSESALPTYQLPGLFIVFHDTLGCLAALGQS